MKTVQCLVTLVAVLVVHVATENRTDTEPRFIEEPSDVTRRIGQSVVLPCKVANRNGGRVQWTRDDFGLGQSRSTDFPRYTVIGNNLDRDWDLQIEQISVDDDSEFECQVVVDARRSLRSQKARLTVYAPPDAPFIHEGPEIHVKEGMAVQLTCVSRGGKPPAKINWYDHNNSLIGNADYTTTNMPSPQEKLFESVSKISFVPGREHDETRFKCEAWNEADDLVIGEDGGNRIVNRSPAFIRIKVQYPPTVSVQAIMPGLTQEGSKASYRCIAHANPPPSSDSYRWYIDSDQVPNQYRSYFEIYNVTRTYHDKQVRCSVYNELGRAEGLKSIQVKYGPSIVQHPKTTAGDNLNSVTLFCVVDGNPEPNYEWTKGDSREIISQEQNMTVSVSAETVGTYFCHARVPGYNPVSSKPAEILMTGKPNISSNPVQRGVVGDNVHIDCAAMSIPLAKNIVWKYHNTVIKDDNSHYRIIQSLIENGLRSTLVIKQAFDSDFGPYTCTVENNHGIAEMDIVLEQQRPIPLQMILIAVFSAVIFVLLFIILLILFRKKCCMFGGFGGKKSPSDSTINSREIRNDLQKTNNIVDQLSGKQQPSEYDYTREDDFSLSAASGVPNPYVSGATLPRMQGATCISSAGSSDLLDPEIPPKPDVIDTGYISYGNNLRDYNPPLGSPPLHESPYGGIANPAMNHSRGSGVLNVSDPRFSATYGNPLLRQAAAPTRLIPHPGTFVASQGAVATTTGQTIASSYSSSAVSSFHPNSGSLQRNLIVSTVPTTNSHYCNNIIPMSSSTPNSSVSNMACLPEELVAFGEDHTGVSAGASAAATVNPAQVRLNNCGSSSSTTSSSCTPSPPNLLPVSQPKVPNLKPAQNRGPISPTKMLQNPRLLHSPPPNNSAAAGDFKTMPSMTSFGSPSVIGVGGPIYNNSQTMSRLNGNVINNNIPRYGPLGVNPVSVNVSNSMSAASSKNNPTYSTVNKAGDGPKISSMGTHV